MCDSLKLKELIIKHSKGLKRSLLLNVKDLKMYEDTQQIHTQGWEMSELGILLTANYLP